MFSSSAAEAENKLRTMADVGAEAENKPRKMADVVSHFEFCGVCKTSKRNTSNDPGSRNNLLGATGADRSSTTVRKRSVVLPGRLVTIVPATPQMNDKEFSALTSPKSGDRGESNTPRTAIEKDSIEQLSSTANYKKSLETRIFLKKSLEEVKRKKERLEKQFEDDLSLFQRLKRQGLKHDTEQEKLIELGKHISSTQQEMDRIKKELESANEQIAKNRQLTGEMARFITNSSPTSDRSSRRDSLSTKAVGTSV